VAVAMTAAHSSSCSCSYKTVVAVVVALRAEISALTAEQFSSLCCSQTADVVVTNNI